MSGRLFEQPLMAVPVALDRGSGLDVGIVAVEDERVRVRALGDHGGKDAGVLAVRVPRGDNECRGPVRGRDPAANHDAERGRHHAVQDDVARPAHVLDRVGKGVLPHRRGPADPLEARVETRPQLHDVGAVQRLVVLALESERRLRAVRGPRAADP